MLIKVTWLITLAAIFTVAHGNPKVVGNRKDSDDDGTVSVVNIQDHNKTQYLNQNFEGGNYNYGYDIKPSGPNGQFHHENKAQDNVVYGCYGYLDPNEENQITFYISDAWGYRPVKQEKATDVFYPADNPEGTTDMKGTLTQWSDLVFPEKCTYFAQQIYSSNPSKGSSGSGSGTSSKFPSGPKPGASTLSFTPGAKRPVGSSFSNSFTNLPGSSASTLGGKVPNGGRNPSGPIGLVAVTNNPIALASQALSSNSGGLPGSAEASGRPVVRGYNSGGGSGGNGGLAGNGGGSTSNPGRNGGSGGIRGNGGIQTGPGGPGGLGGSGTGGPNSPGSGTSGSPVSGGSGGSGGSVGVGGGSGPNAPGYGGSNGSPGGAYYNRGTASTQPIQPQGGNASPVQPEEEYKGYGEGSTIGIYPERKPGITQPTSGGSKTPFAGTNSQGTTPQGSSGSRNQPGPQTTSPYKTPTKTPSLQNKASSQFTTNKPSSNVPAVRVPSNSQEEYLNTPQGTFPDGSPKSGTTPFRPIGSSPQLGNSREVEGSSESGRPYNVNGSGEEEFSSNLSLAPVRVNQPVSSSSSGTQRPGNTNANRPTGTSNTGNPSRGTSSYNSPSTLNTNVPLRITPTNGPSNPPRRTRPTIPTNQPSNAYEQNLQEVEGSSIGIYPDSNSGENPSNGATRPGTQGTRRPTPQGATQRGTGPTPQGATQRGTGPTPQGATQRGTGPTPQGAALGVTGQIIQGTKRPSNQGSGENFGNVSPSYQGGKPSQGQGNRNKPLPRPNTSQSSELFPEESDLPFGSNEVNNNNKPGSNKYSSNSNNEDSSCPSVCNSCSKKPTTPEINYANIPGAVVSNVPVIFYPDCGATAFSQPAIVPYCPAQQPSCSNQSPLTMKFPPASVYNSNSGVPSGRNAYAANLSSELGTRTARRVGVVKRAKQRRRS